LDVLAGRWRTGERVWTFDTAVRPAVRALETEGLVGWKSGSEHKTMLVWLTEKGKDATLDPNYTPPSEKKLQRAADLTGSQAGFLTIHAASERVSEIEAMGNNGDDEAAHSSEDKLYKQALQEISDGHPYPRSLAATVLQATKLTHCRWSA